MTRHAVFRATIAASLALMLGACASQGGVRDDTPPPPVGTTTPTVAATQDADTQVPSGEDVSVPMPDSGRSPTTGDDAFPAIDATDAQASAGMPTQAERDYAALYGEPPYDPVYDATLPAPAQLPSSFDPWEKLNRRVHAFNNVVDRAIAKPLAKAYVKVVPRPLRLGVSNFFHNLGQPVSALNALLQGKPK